MITAILKLLSSLFDFIRWWKRPSKEIRRVEKERDEVKKENVRIVTEGTDEEMSRRINSL